MKKILKLKICNWSLLFFSAAILASGIQLEASHSKGVMPVWIHIIIGLIFVSLIAWHIYLHFGWNKWFSRFHKIKSQATRILWWLYLITFLSGLIATVHWFISPLHSPIGGIHGKIGFVMIAVSIGHICKRFKFFKKTSKSSPVSAVEKISNKKSPI